MKITILFCVIAFACAAQASPDLNDVIPANLQRGSMTESLKEGLEENKEKLDQLIEKATDIVKEKINEAKKQAEELLGKLKDGALEASGKLTESLQKILDRLEEEVSKLEKDVANEGVDVSNCKQLTQTVQKVVKALIANNTRCILERIDTGKKLVVDTIRISEEVLEELTLLKEKGDVCVENVEGFRSIISASTCLSTCGVKASWTISQKVPAVVVNVGKISTLLTTLQTTVSTCMAKNSAVTLTQQATIALGRVKNCISEKIAEAQENKNKEQEKPQTKQPEDNTPVPEITEVPQTQQSEDKTSDVDDTEVPEVQQPTDNTPDVDNEV